MRLNAIAPIDNVSQSDRSEALAFPSEFASVIYRDQLMERLAHDLLPAEEAELVLRGFYTDALHSALLKRLAELRRNTSASPGSRKLMPLPVWRLERVTKYVEVNLQQPLTLGALARVAGLSSMYFAVQFRLATGMRPHDYVVRRRIQRAKAMLLETRTPIVDVADSVGFRSQSHFTTVFKRIVGFTPQRWSMEQRYRASTPLPSDADTNRV